MQTSLSLKYVYRKQITGNVAWIVRVTRSQCRHDSRLTEQPIKTRQSMQTRQFFETSICKQITGNCQQDCKVARSLCRQDSR